MKLRKQDYNFEAVGEFEKSKITIHEDFTDKIILMLIDQYRYPIRTPLQEIISNARDAQRENGNPDTPIKIQLPTRLESTFKVRDYGVGMDEYRMSKIFQSMGNSTKTKSNKETGGFGIGGKSPLRYTDQFNIKTYVDGTYWIYAIIRKGNDEGIDVLLLEKGKTNEPNGTEVQIPVDPNDRNGFIRSACRCTMFWDVQPEFNLSEEDRYNHTNGIYLDNVSIHTNSELGGIFEGGIVLSVDGIPYKLDSDTVRKVKPLSEISNKLNYSNIAVIKLNTGDIDLLQTRENINESEYTLSQLRKIGLKALTDVEEYLSSCYTAKDLEGRIAQHRTLLKNFRNVKSHSFAKVFKLMDKSVVLANDLNFYGYAFKGKWGSRVKTPQKKDNKFFNSRWNGASFNYTDLDRFYWDDLKDSESSTQKARRLRNALIEWDQGQVVVIERGNATGFEYVRTVRMLGAKPLSSLPLPERKKATYTRNKAGKRVKKAPEVITIHDLTSCGTRQSRDIKLSENSTKFVYCDYQAGFNNEWANFITNFTGQQPILLSKTVAKQVKDNPNFITFEAFKANYKPCDEVKNAYIASNVSVYSSNVTEAFRDLVSDKIKQIKDPTLKKLAEYCDYRNKYHTHITLPKEIREDMKKLHGTKINTRKKCIKMVLSKVATRYALLTNRYRVYGNEEIAAVRYLNDTYKARTTTNLPR